MDPQSVGRHGEKVASSFSNEGKEGNGFPLVVWRIFEEPSSFISTKLAEPIGSRRLGEDGSINHYIVVEGVPKIGLVDAQTNWITVGCEISIHDDHIGIRFVVSMRNKALPVWLVSDVMLLEHSLFPNAALGCCTPVNKMFLLEIGIEFLHCHH